MMSPELITYIKSCKDFWTILVDELETDQTIVGRLESAENGRDSWKRLAEERAEQVTNLQEAMKGLQTEYRADREKRTEDYEKTLQSLQDAKRRLESDLDASKADMEKLARVILQKSEGDRFAYTVAGLIERVQYLNKKQINVRLAENPEQHAESLDRRLTKIYSRTVAIARCLSEQFNWTCPWVPGVTPEEVISQINTLTLNLIEEKQELNRSHGKLREGIKNLTELAKI